MKVRELIALLKREDPERLVIIQKDGEGNGFSPLDSVATAAYRADSTWSGEAGLEPEDLTDDLRERGWTEDDVIDGGVPALLLVPVN